MLNDGKCSVSEDVIKPYTSRDLDSIQTFDEFYVSYKDELLKHTKFGMESINRLGSDGPGTFSRLLTCPF